ncbi:hypothetical protein [Niameybacter massiliensis]|uniref:hypothetical protein n=1 Tax=Niameybacter massiliensis TaxID=1658108 RepID=UPI0006B49FA5|nr:hypothetical protein [Niameybacter massiliensis]
MMQQIWIIDANGFYEDESRLVERQFDNHGNELPLPVNVPYTTVPLTVGYVKPKLVDGSWEEGATPEEIQTWKEANKTNIAPDKTEVRLTQIEEAIGMLATQTAKNTLLNGGMK